MPSFGEADIMMSNSRVGVLRVTHLNSYSDIYASLRLGVSLSLRHAQEGGEGPSPFAIDELYGELRLKDTHRQIGTLRHYGQRRPLESSIHGHDQSAELLCELDPWRLEQIERVRDGGKPLLWAEIWATFRAAEGNHLQIGKLRIEPPRDVWTSFLQEARSSTIEILETEYTIAQSGRFENSIRHIRKSKSFIDAGDYDEAIAGCRRAIEAIDIELSAQDDRIKLDELLISVSDPERAKLYAGIVSRMRQLAGAAIHEFGRGTEFSRAEAKYVVSITERLVGFISDVTRSAD